MGVDKDVRLGTRRCRSWWTFGQYAFKAEVLVGNGPVPPPPPPPPPPPGDKKQIVIFYQADKFDNYPQPQRSLLTSLKVREDLVALKHVFLEVLEEAAISTASVQFAPFIAAVQGDPLPRIALVPVEGGKVLDFPLPADYAVLLKLLEQPQ